MPGTSGYPGAIDNYPDPNASLGDKLNTSGFEHDKLHGQVHRAVNQIEDTLGADPQDFDTGVTLTTTPATVKEKTDVLARQLLSLSGEADLDDTIGLSVSDLRNIGISYTIDGGGDVPDMGSRGYVEVPFDCTITGWTMLLETIGSAQVTIKRGTYAGFPTTASIVAAAPPTVTTARKAQSSTLTGWSPNLSAGDILEFNLDSVVTTTRILLALQLRRT